MSFKFVHTPDDKIPACLVQRSKDKDAFRKSYHASHVVTDVIRDEILMRLEAIMFPKEEAFSKSGWDYRQAKNIGRMKAYKEILELLP